jgi:hypothetical protein
MPNNLSNNKKVFFKKANSWDETQRNRSQSVQLPSRSTMFDSQQMLAKTPNKGYTKSPFQFLRKKSGRNLISKSKVYDSNKQSIEGITYPIF